MAVVNVPFDLQRFVNAQNPVYEQVCAELRAGQKEGHWMWFIFPQLRGLGHSAMATAFGIVSRQEATAYLDHAVLGPPRTDNRESVRPQRPLLQKARYLLLAFAGRAKSPIRAESSPPGLTSSSAPPEAAKHSSSAKS
jgi:Protein of unknown function (DUF1810)